MRKRGRRLDSPEANFMFGGPDNEQVYTAPDGQVLPYDRPTAAVDHLIDSPDKVPAEEIISRRDETVKEIDQKIVDAKPIEDQRRRVADALNRDKNVDQQG